MSRELNELWLDWELNSPSETLRRIPESPRTRAIIDTERDAMIERIIGSSVDFLPFRFLELGVKRGEAVGRIKVRRQEPDGLVTKGHGTGFLVAPNLIMTNHHVLPSTAVARDSLLQFSYEIDLLGNEESPDEWELDPDSLFITSPFEELDFTIVAVKKRDIGDAGSRYGMIPLRGNRSNIKTGERVNIIQHPEGRRKEVVMHESSVTEIYEQGYIHYTSDTLRGSSGSPVFNSEWDLVALHHRAVPKRDDDGKPIYENGDYTWIANEGIRISTIVEHLRTSSAIKEDMRGAVEPHLYD